MQGSWRGWSPNWTATISRRVRPPVTSLGLIGEPAVPPLEKLIAGRCSAEARRRADVLLARLTAGVVSPEQVRLMRAIEVLEMAATPTARQLLESLASGAPGVLPTREAQAALDRLRWR
jgi:hypothetical protein